MNPFVIPKTPKPTHSIEEHSDEYFALFKPGEAMRSIFFSLLLHFHFHFFLHSVFPLNYPQLCSAPGVHFTSTRRGILDQSCSIWVKSYKKLIRLFRVYSVCLIKSIRASLLFVTAFVTYFVNKWSATAPGPHKDIKMNSVSLQLPPFICVFNFHHDNLNLVFQALTRGMAAPVKLLREGRRLRGRVQAFCREKKVADASSEDDVWSSCYTPDNGVALLMYSNPSHEPPENAAFRSSVSTQRMTVPPPQPPAGSHPLLPLFVTKCLSNKGIVYKHPPPTSLGVLSRWPCMFASAQILSKHSICKLICGGWWRAHDQGIDWKRTVFVFQVMAQTSEFGSTTQHRLSLMELTFIFICLFLNCCP